MSRGAKTAIIAAVILALLGGIGVAAVMTVGVVTSMSLRQAQLHQRSSNPCTSGAAVMVADAGGPVRLPVTGAFTPTSEFGMRIHPVLGQAKMHWGLDLSGNPRGGAIVAVKDGTVVDVSSDATSGNWIRLDHGSGLSTRYLHLAKTTVRSGDRVTAGQQIGIEGSTGRSTGPHLHFEVKIGNGSPQDPRAWFASQGLTLPRPGQPGKAATINAAAGPSTPTSPPAAPTMQARPVANSTAAPATATSVPGWSSEQIHNAAAIIKAGQDLGADSHTLALGVMTSIGESTLLVVDHGDAAGPDSRGLFQQRANGAWGSYADRMNPYISARNFFTALMKIPNYRALPPTIAAHRTQSNQDPNHYARFWPAAVQIVAAVTGDPALLASVSTDGSAVPCQAGAPGYVDVGTLPGAPGTTCEATNSPAEKGLTPATLRLLRCGATAFKQVRTFCGVGGRPGPSDHPSGRAIDFMIEDHRTAAGRAYGWQVATWMRTHADELNIKYVIWDMKIWQSSQADQGWQPYTRYGPNPNDTLGHRDHVHVSLQH